MTAQALDEPITFLTQTSATGLRWALRHADERVVQTIVQQNRSEILARVLAGRGIEAGRVEQVLSPTLRATLPDPSHLKDMDVAAERLASTIMAGETVAVFGDYDVDGATSSALLVRFLRAVNTKTLVHIPDRMKEGYGPNAPALLSLKERGATVVLTVDCGTLAFEPLKAAYDAGIDVIVVDHHAGEAELPKCLAVINPNRVDETSPHRQLAAVGVTFLLLVATNRLLRKAGWYTQERPEPDLLQWLDLVALGTVCDVVPLTELNRAFVAQGLQVLRRRRNIGLTALLDSARIQEAPNAYHLGFVLGPRINAGGRVGQSMLGATMLATEDPLEATQLAARMEQLNNERKTLEALALEQAIAQAETQSNQPVLIVSSHAWHPGVVGILASRLKDRFHKPALVMHCTEEFGKGSGRSVEGFDLGATIIAARQMGLLSAGGGHAMAAGFTVPTAQMEAFTQFVQERAAGSAYDPSATRTLLVDACVHPQGVNVSLLQELEQLAPFGAGNPSLRLMLPQIKIALVEVVKEVHLRVVITDQKGLGGRLVAMAFRSVGSKLGEALLAARGQIVSVVGQPRLSMWQGELRVGFTLEDIAYV